MLDQATPEQRKELQNLAEQWAKQQSGNQPGSQPGSQGGKQDANRADRGNPSGRNQAGGPPESANRGSTQAGQKPDGSNNEQPGRTSPGGLVEPSDGQNNQAGRSESANGTSPTSSGSFREERVDLSKTNRPRQQRVLADLAPKPGDTGKGSGVITGSGENARVEIQKAADAGERAVEGQAIPARHSDLVRRVFRRLTERAQTESGPAKPAEPSATPETKPK
jgi:hypothetical protein